MFVCLNGMTALDIPESAELREAIRVELQTGLSDALSALAISIQLWVYNEFYSASTLSEAKLRKNALFAEYSAEELRNLKRKVGDSLRQVTAGNVAELDFTRQLPDSGGP